MMGSNTTKLIARLGAILLFLNLVACTTPHTEAPPATLQAVLAGSEIWQAIDQSQVTMLQEQPLGTGELLLYQWQNEAAETCLAAAYVIDINGQWQTHDTFRTACHADKGFVAAYSGNSTAESPYGPTRDTIAYGVSDHGHAVRVAWADGQVSYVPLQNGSFLVARNGRMDVQRVELLDEANNLIDVEDWGTTLN